MAHSDRIMFEIYREADYARQYRVVFFTELDEHNKEQEINRAMAGEYYYDGFITNRSRERAKAVIGRVLDRLNGGEPVATDEIDTLLAAAEQSDS